MVWWEAVLSPALQVLFDKLASGEVLHLLQSCNISDFLLEKLKLAYLASSAVLDDAEERQFESLAVETWLDMLKTSAYEAEEILDVLATEALRCKLQARFKDSRRSRSWNISLSSPEPIESGIDSKIVSIVEKLDYLAKQKDVLGLQSNAGTKRYGTERRLPTTPMVEASRVFGRDHEKEEMIDLLLDENHKKLEVIPVVGMGGLGKTVLAQLVFNEERIDGFFNVKAWACVSVEFDLLRVTKALLESATGKPCETNNLELVLKSLTNILSKKRFLIVLDDLWDEKPDDAWHELQLPLLAGVSGSKVIVTTRRSVTGLCGMAASPPFHLRELSDAACFSLFSALAFGDCCAEAHPALVAVGQEIANKCKGLPLAAKALAGLLSSRMEVDYWHEILFCRNLWDVSSRKSSVMAVLQLSYHHLPANLKRCFAYCSLFPKNFEFDKDDLILLWMAEGFIPQGYNKRMEDVGEEYFDELLARSFFQRSSTNRLRYVMHDLINDLAQFVARKVCIRLDDEEYLENQTTQSKMALHFSYARGQHDVSKRFDALREFDWLRTFLALPGQRYGFCYLSNKVVTELLPRLRRLRVLSLSDYCISDLPESIGWLKHLRYLNLSHTAIKELPGSISTLLNLQTLLLKDCDCLQELPFDFTDLVSLCHFDVSGSALQCMPQNMGRLENLYRMPEFVVGSSKGSDIGELRDMIYLRGTLTLSRLENVKDPWVARKADLRSKKCLDALKLEWSSNFELQDEIIQMDVLEMLQPRQKLKTLSLLNYGGRKFSSWLCDPSFSNMTSVTLHDCRKCLDLPPLGQLPSLRHLYVKGLSSVRAVGKEFYGDASSRSWPFPSLVILHFMDMLEWKDWSCSFGGEEFEAFPSLRELRITACPKLRGKLPVNLSSLEELVIHECKSLSCPLPELPSLRHLDVKGCPHELLGATLNMSALISLKLSEISSFTHIAPGLQQHLTQLKNLEITDCSELRCLWESEIASQSLQSLKTLLIRNCPQLIIITAEEDQRLPPDIEFLELESCYNLQTLPHTLHHLTSLTELVVKDCPGLASQVEFGAPLKLRGLTLRGCEISSLPKGILSTMDASLEYLSISVCYTLNSFPSGIELPTPLQQLTISLCPFLEYLPPGLMRDEITSLQVLEIFECPALTSFPNGQLPPTLKTLTICWCTNLESLADVLRQDGVMALESLRISKCTSLKSLPCGLHKLSLLGYLEIDGCPSLTSFPEGGLPSSSLRKLHVINCENLTSLPEQMRNLTLLPELSLSDCPGLGTLPEGGLPSSLESLQIKDCPGMSRLLDWGFNRFHSLKSLSVIGGRHGLSTLPEWLLPPTLTSLHLAKLPDLDFESNWLRNLTLLQDLKLSDCKKLHSLPVEELPATLSRLEVRGCPLVQKQCEDEWSKIDHIPCIVM